MEKYKIVIATSYVRQEFLDAVAPFCDIIHQWTGPNPMPEDILCQWVQDADGLFAGGGSPVTARVLAAAPHLQVISLPQAGYNEVDIQAATSRGIPVGHTPHVLDETVAELAFGITVCAARDLIPANRYAQSGEWARKGAYPVHGMDLSRRVMGIVGMGNIGVSISRRARAFGMTVLYHNRHQRHDDALRYTTYVPLDELLERSDVVIVAMPLTAETRHMVNASWFKKMKASAIFVNIGRGPIVCTDDLAAALKNGDIAKAALDVVEPEPLPAEHPLLQLPNALVFPHIGSFTERTRGDMFALAARNLLQGLQHESLEACANGTVNYKK